jgi:hypothetical protein
LPPDAAATSLATALEARTIRVSPGVYRYPEGGGMTAGERTAALASIAQLEARLAATVPDDGGTIAESVAEQVYASFKARDGKSNEQTIYDGFLIALPGRAVAAVREAVRRIIRSEAPAKYSRTFVPTAGELAELSMAIEDQWRLDRARLVRLLDLVEIEPVEQPSRPTDAMLAAARAQVARSAEAITAERGQAVPRVSPAAAVAAETTARRSSVGERVEAAEAARRRRSMDWEV